MADWILIPCLRALFMEFDRIAPARDRASDGSIADRAHYTGGTSDHIPDEEAIALQKKDSDRINEVHAIDVDNNLRESDLTMEKVVQFLLGRCRSGAEERLQYIIYNKRIWSASSGWVQKTYTGASPHTEHAHFSGKYISSLEASTASWHLEDIPVAVSPADKTAIAKEAADLAWKEPLVAPQGSDSPTWPAENMARNTYNEAKGARTRVQGLEGQVQSLQSQVSALETKIDAILVKLP
jgi:hypothetical protein